VAEALLSVKAVAAVRGEGHRAGMADWAR